MQHGFTVTRAGLYKVLRHLPNLLTKLKERERLIIAMRYGLEDGKCYTLEEVGREFGVTRERIRQIEAKAVEIMYQQLYWLLFDGKVVYKKTARGAELRDNGKISVRLGRDEVEKIVKAVGGDNFIDLEFFNSKHPELRLEATITLTVHELEN